MIVQKRNAIVIGTGQLAFYCANLLVNDEFNVVVYEYGEYGLSLLHKKCEKANIKYKSVGRSELTDILLNIREKTFVVSANNTFIIPSRVLLNRFIIAINFHPAILPKHPGRNAECWSIYEMDKVTGITWHLIDEQVDHGQIIKQKVIEIDPKDTALKLMQKQFVAGMEAFTKIVEELSNVNDVKELNLLENKTNRDDVHLSSDIPNDGRLDLDWSVDKMYAFCRAMDYGALKVMGDPYCIYKGNRYIWSGYFLKENNEEEVSKVEEGIFANKTHVLKMGGWRVE